MPAVDLKPSEEFRNSLVPAPGGLRRSRRRRTARDNLGGHRRIPAPKNREFMDVGIARTADPAPASRGWIVRAAQFRSAAGVR